MISLSRPLKLFHYNSWGLFSPGLFIPHYFVGKFRWNRYLVAFFYRRRTFVLWIMKKVCVTITEKTGIIFGVKNFTFYTICLYTQVSTSFVLWCNNNKWRPCLCPGSKDCRLWYRFLRVLHEQEYWFLVFALISMEKYKYKYAPSRFLKFPAAAFFVPAKNEVDSLEYIISFGDFNGK